MGRARASRGELPVVATFRVTQVGMTRPARMLYLIRSRGKRMKTTKGIIKGQTDKQRKDSRCTTPRLWSLRRPINIYRNSGGPLTYSLQIKPDEQPVLVHRSMSCGICEVRPVILDSETRNVPEICVRNVARGVISDKVP